MLAVWRSGHGLLYIRGVAIEPVPYIVILPATNGQIAHILIGSWYNTVIPSVIDVRGGDSAHPRVSVSVDLPLVRSYNTYKTNTYVLRMKD